MGYKFWRKKIYVKFNHFITLLIITWIQIKHVNVIAPKSYLLWNFTKELYENDHGMVIFL